jgi:2-C-methyl-D-erythritol 4-phosphate cytidylyltransferase
MVRDANRVLTPEEFQARVMDYVSKTSGMPADEVVQETMKKVETAQSKLTAAQKQKLVESLAPQH